MSQRADEQTRRYYGTETRRVEYKAPPRKEHKPDRSCCEPVKLRLQTDLYNRLRCRPYYHTDAYSHALAAFEGQVVTALHTFESSYTIETPDGKLFDLPALYADRVSQ